MGVTLERRPETVSGLDRVVFEFTAPVANYYVRYVKLPVTLDPSDLPVALHGDRALQISMAANRARHDRSFGSSHLRRAISDHLGQGLDHRAGSDR